MPRWEYATLNQRSRWIRADRRWEWTLNIIGTQNENLIDTRTSSEYISQLPWLNWMGQQGWEVIAIDTARRAFAFENDPMVESRIASVTVYFKRLVTA